MTIEIVDFPSYKMVDLSSSLCDSLPEGNMDVTIKHDGLPWRFLVGI
jgi:hypothetical protein